MATAYLDPGSPLADYLDDDETAPSPSLDEVITALPVTHSEPSQDQSTSPSSPSAQMSPALVTSPTSAASPASHTSQTSSTAPESPELSASPTTSIRLTSPTTPTAPTPISAPTTSSLSVRPSPSRKLSDDGFAERFKYLICSSALLERDYVPGLGVDADDAGSQKSASPTAAHFMQPALVNAPRGGRPIWDQARSVIKPVWLDLQRAVGLGRWDIVLAGAVGLVSVGWILGWKKVLSVMVMAICAVGFWVYLTLEAADGASTALAEDSTPLPTGVSPQPSSRSDALDSLTDLLSSSRKLDNSIERSLAHLNPHPTDHQQLHSLRVALHRLTSAMTDNLATATSSLLELVDRDELAVLGEMYDIPVVGSFLYTRKARQTAITGTDDEVDPEAVRQSSVFNAGPDGTVPSPRRPRLSLSFHPTDTSSGTYTQPMSMSRSLPGHGLRRQTHTPRSHHLSLSLSPRRPGTPISAASAPDDRFTSLPSRTPRISKRSSWDVDTWSTVRDQLNSSLGVKARRLSRPSHERRITEADENDPDDRSASEGMVDTRGILGDDTVGSTGRPAASSAHSHFGPGASASAPSSPSPFPRQTRTTRRSPLAGDPNIETLPPNGTFPAPFKSASSTVTTPNAKRRSLQNMPYNPPNLSPPDNVVLGADMAGEGLTRTRSLPFTDIQSLRSRYATGNRSRTSSIVNGSPSPSSPYAPEFAVALHSPTPRIRRVVSVSPLTLPSLKAACHAIHMRRRRLACCLLGLRFDQPGAEYWDDVVGAMRELQSQVDVERERLDEAIHLAREQLRVSADSVDEQRSQPAPWTHRQMDSLDSTASLGNFAPRSSDEQQLMHQIEAIRFTLDRAWKDLDRAGRAISSDRAGSGTDTVNVDKIDIEWSAVRRNLGEIVRSWERGREVLKRMQAARAQRGRDSPEDHGAADAADPSANHGGPGDDPEPAPEFLRAWSDDGGSPSTSFETDRAPASLDGQAENPESAAASLADLPGTDLPVPGRDVVFEADVPGAAVRERSTMSRDERIRLAKEARAKGLTLGEMLAHARAEGAADGHADADADADEQARKAADRERFRQGGMVLDELRGMMDLIKARKA